jgi:hypothetical protein
MDALVHKQEHHPAGETSAIGRKEAGTEERGIIVDHVIHEIMGVSRNSYSAI